MKKYLTKIKLLCLNIYIKVMELLILFMINVSIKLMQHLITLNKDDKFKLTFQLFDMPQYYASRKIAKTVKTSYKLIDTTLEVKDLSLLEKSLDGENIVLENITDDAKSERVKVKFKQESSPLSEEAKNIVNALIKESEDKIL